MKNLTIFNFIALILLCCCLACNQEKDKPKEPESHKEGVELAFDKAKWKVKSGSNYPYREQMLNDVLYNDDIRKLKEAGVIEQLGKPDRINEDHLYYEISRTRLGFWTLHARTMVIKIADDKSVEWIKVNE